MTSIIAQKTLPEKHFGAKFGSEGSTTTDTSYATIADSDIALDPDLYKHNGKLWVRFIYHIVNSESDRTTSIQVYRQNAASAVVNSEQTTVSDHSVWQIKDTGWIDWSAETGSESYQIQLKTSNVAGTAEYNSAIMLLSWKRW